MSGSYSEVLQGPLLVWVAGLGFLIYLGLSLIGIYIVYFLLSFPLRRAERARLLLDLLELGVGQGLPPEQIVVQVAASGDPLFGRKFRRLAREVSGGQTLGAALAKQPHLVSAEIAGMIGIGERVGDVRKVIPAVQRRLSDALSQTRGALNYVLVVTLASTPAMLILPIAFQVLVAPRFTEIFHAMTDGSGLPAFTRFILGAQPNFVSVQAVVLVLVWLGVLAYTGGPRLRGWIRRFAPNLVDRLVLALPWRRKRVQRDFSAMLAVLLDAGLKEEEAVRLAGEATNNLVFVKRAALVRERLRAGVALPEAIHLIEQAGEFEWRLANALRRGTDFQNILAGWHDALEARAFQQEQAAAQIATTGLVLYNGLVIGLVVSAIFLGLVSLIQTATLW